MRIAACIVLAALGTSLSSAQGASQSAMRLDAAKKREMCATSRYFSKGGIGKINKHLYVVVKSASDDRNELIVKPAEDKEERWKGKSASKAEVVIVFEGMIWSSQGLPDQFDLSKAVVVSFEGDKVRFFDFHTMSGGGYYERIRE